jgi:hypothetical protein
MPLRSSLARSGMLSLPTATLRVRGQRSPQHEPYTRIYIISKNRTTDKNRYVILKDNVTSHCAPLLGSVTRTV